MRISIIILSLLALSSSITAKNDKATNPEFCQPVYIYGIATSFNDSIAYLTDVQYLDSAYIENGQFLGDICGYSSQLSEYFTKNNDARVCAVYFATSQKKAEKRYLALRKKLQKPKSRTLLKPLTIQDFKFKSIRPIVDSDEKPVAKKEKKEKKHDKRREMPDGKRPPMGGPGQGMGPGNMGGPGQGMGRKM